MIEQAALANYSPAILKLAWSHLFGSGHSINPAKSHSLFSSLVDQGNPEAQMGMAFLYATGTVVNSSQSQALLYYTFGAFGGSQWAQMALGYRYWSGMGVATSCERPWTTTGELLNLLPVRFLSQGEAAFKEFDFRT